jgi:hypothetical protein
MKNKIIGIFLCILLISAIVYPVTAITDFYKNQTILYEAEIPIWEKGDQWTYNFIESRSQMFTYTLSGEYTMKVIEDSGDSYILEAKTRPHGNFDMGGYGLKTTRLTFMTMRIQMRKTDLALENFFYQLKGFLLVTIGPVTIPIPIQVDGSAIAEFDPPWIIMPFPLYDGKSGELSGTEILNINVYFSIFWGLVSVYGPQNYSIPYFPIPYTCTQEQITVEAGIFDVFNVSAETTDGSRFISCYSEEIGNVAREEILIPFGGERVQYSLILELTDWSYTP